MRLKDLPPEFQKQALKEGALSEGKLGQMLRRSKYNNQPTRVGSRLFDSKHEANVYSILCLQYGEKNIACQVSFPIGAERIRLDFMLIHERFDDGTFRAELIDAKGVVTPTWRAKANHLKDALGLTIRKIFKGKQDERT